MKFVIEKVSLGRQLKNENRNNGKLKNREVERLNKIKIGKLRIQNIVILSFTTKSGAPDHPIRSVSSSQYDVTHFQIIS